MEPSSEACPSMIGVPSGDASMIEAAEGSMRLHICAPMIYIVSIGEHIVIGDRIVIDDGIVIHNSVVIHDRRAM